MRITFNWKRFIQMSLLLNCLLVLSACTLDWIKEANTVIALVGPMAAEIIALLSAFGVGLPKDTATIVNTALREATDTLNNVVQPLLAEYESSPAADQPSILAKIQAALKAVSDNLNGMLASLHVTNPGIQQKITDVVTAFLDEIVSLEQILPILKSGGLHLSEHEAAKFHKLVQHVKASELKKRFNAAMLRPTPDQGLNVLAAKFVLK